MDDLGFYPISPETEHVLRDFEAHPGMCTSVGSAELQFGKISGSSAVLIVANGERALILVDRNWGQAAEALFLIDSDDPDGRRP